MKNFGERFTEYQPLGIEDIIVPEVKDYYSKDSGLSANESGSPGRKTRDLIYMGRTMGGGSATDRLKEELGKVVVKVAPTANVYQISSSQRDLATPIKKTLSEFKYYIVELGLNVMLERGIGIPELLFEVDIKCDGKDRTDATAFDIAPDDSFRRIKVISGKIGLGVTKLLKFIPHPIAQKIPDLLKIEINPWEFEWGFDKYMIDASGEKNYKVDWKIYRTNVVQGFNPTMIIKARKNVTKITASTRCIYKLKAGLLNFVPEIKTNKKEIKIWPM